MKSFKDYVAEAEQTLAEKAVSQQQQKFMGMVHAMQKGKKIKGASPELKKVAKTMGKKDAKDFASTKHKGLPKKVDESVLNDDQRSTFDHIIDRFKHEVKLFRDGGELDDQLYDALYDYYTHSGEMPYGVAKGRTGDPYNWISFRLDQDLGLDEAVRPEDVPAFQRKAAGKDFPVSMAQVQDQSDKISDLATLRKMAGLPYKPPASIPIK
jgi:hypothetical protein